MISVRSFVLAAALLLVPASAFAACQCVCVGNQMRPVCGPWDFVAPICQGFCGMTIQPERTSTPLAGGQRAPDPSQVDPSAPANPTNATPFQR